MRILEERIARFRCRNRRSQPLCICRASLGKFDRFGCHIDFLACISFSQVDTCIMLRTSCNRLSAPCPNPSNAPLASSFIAMVNRPPVSNLLRAVPPLSSASASLIPFRLSSSSVSGAFNAPDASCFLHPSGSNSFISVTKMLSRNLSVPSSLTSVKRVDANSIFCRTGAESGTYVTAT